MDTRIGHTGLGISSFILTILSGLGLFVCIVYVTYLETSTPGGVDEESIEAIVAGLFMFLFIFMLLIAIGLGIAGVVQKTKKRVFAIISLSISISAVVATIGLMILGLMVDA